MKTSVKTLFASALTAIVLSTSAFTSNAAGPVTNLTTISSGIDFNKVVVKGNVHVELVQADRQRVIIYNEYNKDLTTVVQRGDKLFINSNEDQPITIIVYVKNLQRIDASNTASVITKGKFSAEALQVFLKDNARADVNATASSLYTYVIDNSALKLRGTSTDHMSVKGKVAKLKMEEFAAVNTTTKALDEELIVSTAQVSDTLLAGNKARSKK
ncbi:GIN domain-containing protein [Pedobacter sp. MC2016-24]|uniref:GIN domain-containing protein n=1 Tax=Pedobacter sp. MC2016-24 TaxID=2780090 RepID=UPI0018807C65|nr:DUF2807 domain-containing protein [Pedobacter sp. MC2016-24]MBE9600523.1 DUF2807 domain-containing protein [Pedobacter sp. MC2016-24]